MNNYPEPVGRILDIVEIAITVAIAAALCACVCFAVYFAAILLEGVL